MILLQLNRRYASKFTKVKMGSIPVISTYQVGIVMAYKLTKKNLSVAISFNTVIIGKTKITLNEHLDLNLKNPYLVIADAIQ